MVIRKVYYLSSCSTSKRIIEAYKLREKEFTFQDIKSDRLTPNQLDNMAELTGSYEKLFSRIARKYRELNLKEQVLNEEEYRRFILDDYTFLKRPVIVIDEAIFVGSGKPNLKSLSEKLG